MLNKSSHIKPPIALLPHHPRLQKILSIITALVVGTLLIAISSAPVIKNTVGISIVLTLMLALLIGILTRCQAKANQSLSTLNHPNYSSHMVDSKRPLFAHSFSWACLLYFACSLLSFFAEEPDTRMIKDLDIPFRFVIIPLFGFALGYFAQITPIKIPHIACAFFIASLMALATAVFERYVQHNYRVLGSTNHHILFGSLAMMIAATCLALPFRFKLLGFLGFLFATSAALLSTSRGAWLAIVLVPCLHLFIVRKELSRAQLALIITTSGFVIAGFLFLPTTSVSHRLAEAHHDISTYFKDNNHLTSVGLRFEMWKAAWLIFKENWLFGAGLNEYTTAVANMVQAGETRDLTGIHQHPHNDFLNTLATRGILGGLSYLSLLIVPCIYFSYNIAQQRQRPTSDDDVELNSASTYLTCYHINGLCLAGIYTAITFAIAGLSEALLHRNSSTTFYLTTITLFYLLVEQEKRALRCH